MSLESTDKTDNEPSFTRPDRLISDKTQERLHGTLRYAMLAILIIYIGFPLYWIIINAFRPTSILFDQPPAMWPTSATVENFTQLLFNSDFLVYFFNSVVVGLGATVLTTILATLGGYGLTRANFKGKRNLARAVLFTYMFPAILLAIPLYIVFFNLNMLNSRLSLILGHTAISLPFSLWLMWQFFQTVPQAYEESAWINGAGRLRTLKDVIFPMARPGIIAVAIFTFAITWNDYTIAVVLMTDSSMYTLPVGINTFVEQQRTHWGLITASAVLIMVPCFLLVMFLQKYLIQGFSVGEMN